MTADSLPAAAHADHLTRVLLKSGVLGDCRVGNVVVENSRATILSTITRLRLTYEGAAAGAPPALILKTNHPERVGNSRLAAHLIVLAAAHLGGVHQRV